MWLDNRLQFHSFGILHLIPYFWLRTTCTSFSPLTITLFSLFPPYISFIKMTMVHFCCSDFCYKVGLHGLTKDLVQYCNNYNILDCYHKKKTKHINYECSDQSSAIVFSQSQAKQFERPGCWVFTVWNTIPIKRPSSEEHGISITESTRAVVFAEYGFHSDAAFCLSAK